MVIGEESTASWKESGSLETALDEHALVTALDAKGRIIYASQPFCALSQYGQDELLRVDHRIVQANQHPKEYIENLWATIRNGKVWKGELRNRAKDGSFYWVEATIVPGRRQPGIPRHYVTLYSDITERKRLEGSAAYLASIVASSDDAIIGKDLRGLVTSWNDGAAKVFGYTAQEMIGQPIMRLIPAERQREEVDILRRIERGESVKHFETERRRKDGTMISISVTVSPIKDSTGRIVGASKVARNITERLLLEEKFRQGELASRARLRQFAARIISVQEEERERIAREIHDEFAQQLVGLGYDLARLETQVRAIGAKAASPCLKKLGRLRKSVETALQTVRSIATEIRPPILHSGLVNALAWKAREFEASKGIICHFQCNAEEIPLPAEKSLALFRIFQEALTNVARHAQADSVHASLVQTNGTVKLLVRDNGKGFQPRAHAEPKSLGLLGMKERAFYAGGCLRIGSKPGKGTTVEVEIPLTPDLLNQ